MKPRSPLHRKPRKVAVGALGTAALLVATACGDATHSQRATSHLKGNGIRQQNQTLLRAVDGCDDLVASRKADITERMNTQLDQQLAYALGQIEDPDNNCYGCGYYGEDDSAGVGMPCYMDGEADASAGGAPTAGGAPNSPSPNQRADEYSTTNNQVGGVDEADLVKNDGQFIYLASGTSFLILKAWPANETNILASVELEATAERLFVEGDRALIYARNGVTSCSYDSYDGGYTPTGGELNLIVLDIADRDAPALERQITLSGNFVAARRIGDIAYTVATFATAEPAFPSWPTDLPYWLCESTEHTAATVTAAFEALRTANQGLIDALTVSDFVPGVVDIDFSGPSQTIREGLFADCQNFFDPTTTAGEGLLSVLSIDLFDDQSFGSASILGRAGDVYASAQSLYVGVHEYNYDYSGADYTWSETTTVHKFNLDGLTPAYLASGSVPGRLVNQFAMDEHGGNLRVATSSGELWGGSATNAVYVLSQQSIIDVPADCGPNALEGSDPTALCELAYLGEELAVIGALENLAPGEDIRSARFDGDRGFLVTFKKTDPLYAFDLSEPTAPAVTGELKIPGFSTYMHFMDEDHLLTIGFDAADQGDFAWFTGIQLQIFDISNPAELRLVHKEMIGSRGTTSDATDDHLAFNYFPQRNLLALPMGICEGGNDDGGYGSQMTFNGLMVYEVTAADGFNFLGGVDHRDPNAAPDPYGYNSGCYNWWQTPNSQVKRSVLMADSSETYAYSISGGALKVNALSDLATDLVSIELPAGAASNGYDSCYF